MATEIKKIEDTGEFIAGARKDWHLNAMTSKDLANLTLEEKVKHIKKDNVWPKPNFEELVKNGMSPLAAALIKVMRDQMSQQPRADLRGVDPNKGREAFVEIVGHIKQMAENCRTDEDVLNIYSNFEKYANENIEGQERFLFFKNRYSPLRLDYKNRRTAEQMVRSGFPDQENEWKKNLAVYSNGRGSFYLVKSKRILKTDFESEESAWKWAKENAKTTKRTKDPNALIEPKRPHLAKLSREGLTYDRSDKNITPEDFLETFGFRGIQFGNWLPNVERQQVLNIGYEALMDLSEVMNWEPKALSLDGTLGLAFGSRGSGRAAAHYEPGQRVINMTKLSGAGSLAHEFAHALDHWLGTGNTNPVAGGIPSATGWDNPIASSKDTMPHRETEIIEACDQTMKDIYTRKLPKEEKLERLNEKLTSYQKELKKHLDRVQEIQEKELERSNRKYIKEVQEWSVGRIRAIEHIKETISSIENGSTKELGTDSSHYYHEAKKLCKSSDYYRRPNELFARAFESWVFDEVQSKGGTSDYLVHGVESDRYNTEEYRGNPYPCGEERDLINSNMRIIAETVKPVVELNLEKSNEFKI